MASIDSGDVGLVESTAIPSQVMPGHTRDTTAHAEARAKLRTLLESPATELVDVSTPIARKAGELRVAHKMTTCGAVHLATAILARG